MKTKSLPKELICEVSSDEQYLKQYHLIREYAYRVDLGLKHFSGDQDEDDSNGHSIILRKGHFCIGGSRLNISYKDDPCRLPFEDDKFNIANLFPEIANYNYCELGRTAILPQYRDGENLDAMFQRSAELALEKGCDFLMGVSPASVIRRFRSCFTNLGHEMIIFHELTPPQKAIHENLRLKLGIVSLEKRVKIPKPSVQLAKELVA